MSEGPNKGFLHDVFRFLVVQQDASRDAVEVAIGASCSTRLDPSWWHLRNIKFVRGLNQVSFHAFQGQNAMEEIMCDYSLETYRSRPAQLGEKYETHRFPSFSIGFIAPGDPSTAVCMACDTKLRLEGIPEKVQRAYFVTRNEDVTFTRLEDGPHHDGVRFDNGAEVTLQQLGTGVQGWVYDALSSPLAVRETAEAF